MISVKFSSLFMYGLCGLLIKLCSHQGLGGLTGSIPLWYGHLAFGALCSPQKQTLPIQTSLGTEYNPFYTCFANQLGNTLFSPRNVLGR